MHPNRPLTASLAAPAALVLCMPSLPAQVTQAAPTAFPLFDAALFDRAVFAQSVAGVETPFTEQEAKGGPAAVVWSKAGKPDWRGLRYGASKESGARHLRIGFNRAVAVGSVLVSGGGTLSVLKPDAPYPGDLSDDSQWIPAERLEQGAASHAEVREGAYALWVLPPGTHTRALRFTHAPDAADTHAAGVLGGLWILEQRMGNLAPQALVQSRMRDDQSAKLVDESHNRTWAAWENGEKGAPQTISADNPEWVTFSWPKAVTLSGVSLLWAGFSACDIEAFSGEASETLAEAPASKWQRVGGSNSIDPIYPNPLAPNWIAFDRTITTRALRLRITAPARASHPHLNDKIKEGRRVWLGEFVALAPLAEDAGLASLVLPKQADEPPPIPIHFTLPEAGLVTLVIEDQAGHRIRNLVSETPFPAGANTAWWDGSDDLLRDAEAARHGVYHIPSRPVAPGTYKVRGLWHKPLKLHYEFSIYNAGKPAWTTADNTGGWLTTHTPPTSVAHVPGSKTADGRPLIFMGAYVAEGGHGLQWLLEDGTKVGGQHWVGGTWTGAPTLAVDLGADALADELCYVGSVWEGELRITAKTRSLADRPVFKTKLGDEPSRKKPAAGTLPPELEGFDGGANVYVLAGIAARDGVIACSMVRQNELLLVDAKSGALAGKLAVENPRGVCFDAAGRMLVLSGTRLLRYASSRATTPEVVLQTGLEDPRHVTVDETGNLWISERGAAHQVKVFSSTGQLLRTIGEPGAPSIGAYRELHMNQPNGLALDSQGRLWVAEASNAPRRVSLWNHDGRLQRAFYGPTEYGGGGVLDSRDSSTFFYKGMEFALDWKSGTDRLVRIFALPDPLLTAHFGHYSPDYPLYPKSGKGARYFTSCYTHNPVNGDNAAFLWRDDGVAAKLVAGCGDAHAWGILRTPPFRALWPEGTKPEEENPQPEKHAAFVWHDRNGDGRPQPEEVQLTRAVLRGVTVMEDASFVAARFGEHAVRFKPRSFDAAGVPEYDLRPETLGPAGGNPPSSGGNQALVSGDWTVYTNAPQPYLPQGLGGSRNGEPLWTYPSPWPGLHASHEAAVPDRPGMVVGHTRLLGGCVNGQAGSMFAINGNMGNMYLLTVDGLFVSTLFHDIRLRPNWAPPVAKRDMDVSGVSLHDENFWPSITQTPDGRVFLVDGGRTSLVRVDGLETLQRLPEQTLRVTTAELDKAREWQARAELARQAARGSGTLAVTLRAKAPVIDGNFDEWPETLAWASIDQRGTKANFNSDSRPYEARAAVCVSGERLFAAWRTTEKNLLHNTGDTTNAWFKSGGCLDLMLQTDTDLRLLITLIQGRPRALLYRSKVPGTSAPVAFSSPWRTITMDAVEEVSDRIEFASDKTGNYELSVPLDLLHWKPRAGDSIRADVGLLRGSNGQTTQRVYWANKATAITADVPSEAELTPKLWGSWKINAE